MLCRTHPPWRRGRIPRGGTHSSSDPDIVFGVEFIFFLVILDAMANLARNKRATFDYEILERFEAGIVLSGQEVKSAKTGHIRLQGAFVQIRNDEMWLKNAFIAPYTHAAPSADYDPSQNRKLLMHRREIKKLKQKQDAGGLTIVPISAYTKAGSIKIELWLARGKKQFEKRAAIRDRDVSREIRTRQYRTSP